jgi:membrane-bound metal-dependent hydrolase YbcI (DUF457 family)
MDSLFHFIFPIIAALAAKVHVKHEIRNILIVGVLAVLIDVDHFVGVERATFHNIFVTFLLPIIIIILAFSFKTNYSFKGFSILLLIFLSSHTFLDVFSGPPGVALFYPISDTYYSLEFGVTIPLKTKFAPSIMEGYIISSLGLGILLYLIIIILPCLFLDDIIETMEKKHEGFRKALRSLSHPKK